MKMRICTLAVIGTGLYSLFAVAESPESPGPYPVGVTTIQMQDPSRMDPTLKAPRPLLVEIWYPAAESARAGTPAKFTDFFMGGKDIQMNTILTIAFRFNITEIDKHFKTLAVRDGEIADGKFPLLIFSHGNGGMRSQSTFWCDHMASHGYIVVAPDHTRNACATSFEGKVIPYDNEGRPQAALDRPKDVSFLIDQLGQLNGDAKSHFFGKVDLENIGVAGHSFGGFTAMAAVAQDPRIDAIAPMAGVVPESISASPRPLLLFIATEDDTIGEKGNAGARAYFEATTAPKYLVEFKDGGHYTFSDMDQINPKWGDGAGSGTRITNGQPLEYFSMRRAHTLTNGYSVAFFDKFLKGDSDGDEYLNANQLEDSIIHKANHGG
ncbi:MAG: dienelactone hydrolase family protein [Candidatus Hydrogenedentes bacterium]|nr:dienelactone hydrolase family protein [Candidatus Hydrogenedentota bacterium]